MPSLRSGREISSQPSQNDPSPNLPLDYSPSPTPPDIEGMVDHILSNLRTNISDELVSHLDRMEINSSVESDFMPDIVPITLNPHVNLESPLEEDLENLLSELNLPMPPNFPPPPNNHNYAEGVTGNTLLSYRHSF